MIGVCMCGDPCCPSCGPAQGYCPECYSADLDECICNDEPEGEDDEQDS